MQRTGIHHFVCAYSVRDSCPSYPGNRCIHQYALLLSACCGLLPLLLLPCCTRLFGMLLRLLLLGLLLPPAPFCCVALRFTSVVRLLGCNPSLLLCLVIPCC